MNTLQQSSSEECVASRISKSPTGRIRLLESIPERKNMQRALHFARYVDDCVIFVRSERGGKRVMNFPSFGLVFPWTRSCLISRTATYGMPRRSPLGRRRDPYEWWCGLSITHKYHAEWPSSSLRSSLPGVSSLSIERLSPAGRRLFELGNRPFWRSR